MLTNVLRLLGAIKNQKSERKIETRPAMVIMPCSPNHGVFGARGTQKSLSPFSLSLLLPFAGSLAVLSLSWQNLFAIVS